MELAVFARSRRPHCSFVRSSGTRTVYERGRLCRAQKMHKSLRMQPCGAFHRESHTPRTRCARSSLCLWQARPLKRVVCAVSSVGHAQPTRHIRFQIARPRHAAGTGQSCATPSACTCTCRTQASSQSTYRHDPLPHAIDHLNRDVQSCPPHRVSALAWEQPPQSIDCPPARPRLQTRRGASTPLPELTTRVSPSEGTLQMHRAPMHHGSMIL